MDLLMDRDILSMLINNTHTHIHACFEFELNFSNICQFIPNWSHFHGHFIGHTTIRTCASSSCCCTADPLPLLLVPISPQFSHAPDE